MKTLIVGIIAGTLCTISFIPQLVKIIKTKQTKDLSLITFSVFAVGILLWFVYGLMINQLPIVLANAVTLGLIIIILIAKIRYG